MIAQFGTRASSQSQNTTGQFAKFLVNSLTLLPSLYLSKEAVVL
jgi:hypothetical protein